MSRTKLTLTVLCAAVLLATSALAQLPSPGMKIDPANTALVITDPQNDSLTPEGVAWEWGAKNIKENNTGENIETLFKLAKARGIPVFVSPHYYFPTDHGWKLKGALEVLMHKVGMYDRAGALNLKGFEGSGADWVKQYEPYIEDGETVISTGHKVYGPETNDLVLQLRKRGIDRVILGGMSANLCTESHMRELVEQGFEVAMVSDSTAAVQVAEGDGYRAALTNFRFIASAVWTTAEVVEMLGGEVTD